MRRKEEGKGEAWKKRDGLEKEAEWKEKGKKEWRNY